MAGTNLLTLIDDIATLLDDVAVLTKVAAKKTAGVLGDDLALNAEQVTGVATERELPVVWAVAKGSARNKLVIVPAALAISALAPWAVVPILMIGGAFLCFEGFEKVVHKLFHRPDEAAHQREHVRAVADPQIDIVGFEKDKIRGAIRTDVILSAEIIVIALGTVATRPFVEQVLVLSIVAAGMTVGVYGFVAGIVKLDDAGLALRKRQSKTAQWLGRGILRAAPYLMKGLGIAGTAAMFLVGGGILVHGIPPLHHLVEAVETSGGLVGSLLPVGIDGIVGVVAGAVALGAVKVIARLRSGSTEPEAASGSGE